MPVALPADHVAALERIFQHLPPGERAERIADALPLLEDAAAHNLHLLVARHDQHIIGAMMLQALPGGMGVVWPPAVANGCPDRTAHEDALLAEAMAWLRDRGARLAQSLLAVEDLPLAEPLRRNGFTHPTRLWYLRHDLELTAELLVIPERLSFEAYDDCDRNLFHRTLLHSYDGTRDFPELNNRRPLDEVLAGLKASGFHPRRWWLARAGGDPAGVVLLGGTDEDWELLYTGVLPEARRRGFGMELVRKAIIEAEAAAAGALSLSVDARNEPAWRLYRRLNFVVFGAREVFLKMW
jgi:mycothiol synthase